jgi:2-oxoisovalerate dehydrogenase E2 component (dihydrolipoyl transacylase)
VSDLKQFKLPDIGEGLTEADIISWSVQPGDTVVVNQILVEIETAKAAVELPSPYAGVVTELHAAEGDTVDVGRPIITIDIDPSPAAEAAVEAELTVAAETGTSADFSHPSEPNGAGRQPMLVGYGPKAEGTAQRRTRTVAAAPATATEAAAVITRPEPVKRALAKPPVRLLGRQQPRCRKSRRSERAACGSPRGR